MTKNSKENWYLSNDCHRFIRRCSL